MKAWRGATIDDSGSCKRRTDELDNKVLQADDHLGSLCSLGCSPLNTLSLEGATMPMSMPTDDEDWLSRFDLSAIADPGDKVSECEYFLEIASSETDRDRFRWQISAFFNAAYSYFETTALSAYFSISDPQTGESVEDSEALAVLRKYVRVVQNAKTPNYVKTAGFHPIAVRLYEFRKANTHHFPMSIMIAGRSLPEGFHFGTMTGKGAPALEFCRNTIALIRTVQAELDA